MKPLPSALSILVLTFLCVPAAASAAESKLEESAAADTSAAQGLRLSPAISWSRGQQRIDLSASLRFRSEGWDAHNDDTDFFHAFRTRLGVRYTWSKLGSVFAELQDARIHSLDGGTSGAAALYWTHGSRRRNVHATRLRQLWLELEPLQGLALRLGRQDIKLGTQALYPEANWKYLKLKRLSQRLVGTVGWTHGERSNDGVTVAYNGDRHHVYAFLTQPTTGVFDINSSYAGQEDITYGGVSWTVKRDVWMQHTEFRFFALGYEDDRPASDGGLPLAGDVEVWTAGLAAVGIYPMGPGNLDALLWGAVQGGHYPGTLGGLDHRAWAGIFEIGYQFTGAFMKPWFRAGVNLASGDSRASDGDHTAFFNMLPTNHLYYGYADRFAFSNLLNYFAQLKLRPTKKAGLELFLHRFQQLTSDDLNYFGTGAFNKNVFGLSGRPVTSHRGLATELDLVVSYALHPKVSLLAGYVYMFGNARFNALADDDVRFGFIELALRY
jgi:hypothetical protein